MTKLVLLSAEGFSVSYDMAAVKRIEHGKAKDHYSKSDYEGNGLKANDSMIIIRFKDDGVASFGDNWFVTFE